MSLNDDQKKWFDNYLARQRVESLNPPHETKLTGDVAKDEAILKGDQIKQQQYANNLYNLTKTAVSDALHIDGNASPAKLAVRDKEVNDAIEQRSKAVKDGTSLDLSGMIKLPSMDVTSLMNNPSGAFSLLNPMSWLAPIGNILNQIPIVRQLQATVKELMTGGVPSQGFDFGKAWDRAGVRISLEDAGMPSAVVENAMSDYQNYVITGQLPSPTARTSSVDPKAPSGMIAQPQNQIPGKGATAAAAAK